MSYENISAELADDTLEQLIQKVKEMDETLSFAVYLSPEERQSPCPIGRKGEGVLNHAIFSHIAQKPLPGARFSCSEQLLSCSELR
jgi:hypothetical protein